MGIVAILPGHICESTRKRSSSWSQFRRYTSHWGMLQSCEEEAPYGLSPRVVHISGDSAKLMRLSGKWQMTRLNTCITSRLGCLRFLYMCWGWLLTCTSSYAYLGVILNLEGPATYFCELYGLPICLFPAKRSHAVWLAYWECVVFQWEIWIRYIDLTKEHSSYM